MTIVVLDTPAPAAGAEPRPALELITDLMAGIMTHPIEDRLRVGLAVLCTLYGNILGNTAVPARAQLRALVDDDCNRLLQAMDLANAPSQPARH